MRKEFGKWLMDIAKYVVTGVIIASLVSGREAWFIYAGGGSVSLACLIAGLIFVKKEVRNDIVNCNSFHRGCYHGIQPVGSLHQKRSRIFPRLIKSRPGAAFNFIFSSLQARMGDAFGFPKVGHIADNHVFAA
ncbi:MAG: hypothetical protein LBT83_06210 [Tannerella sp.]|jgi:hypothetical protein|nr:hypothetical protein [Tannerella sp.]